MQTPEATVRPDPVLIVRTALEKPGYEGDPPSQAGLMREQESLRARHEETLAQVGRLMKDHEVLSAEVSGSVETALEQKRNLEELAARDQQAGLLASISRAFTRRRAILERKSAAEQLVEQFKAVQVSLSRASAFSDELRLCALELQAEVDRLHQEVARAGRNAKMAAEKVMEIEEALEQLDRIEGLNPDEKARYRDALGFEQRTQGISCELFRARRQLCRQELMPARELRDTVLKIHEDMAKFVQRAGSSVNGQGHRIQALGLAADAPMVVAELHERMRGMDDLARASQVYIQQAQHLLTEVLPELSNRIEARSRDEAIDLVDDLDDLSRDRSRELADRALREAAEAEVDAALSLDRTL